MARRRTEKRDGRAAQAKRRRAILPTTQWALAWRAVAAAQERAKRAGISGELLERERARALGIPFDEPERVRARVLLTVEPRATARALGIPFDEPERRREREAVEVKLPKPRAKPPKAISVLRVAKRFDDVGAAVAFARANQIPPQEWADDVAEAFDVDVHELYADYYDTDPAQAA